MSCQSYTGTTGRKVAVGDVFHEIDGGDWRIETIQFDSASAAHAACMSDRDEPRVIPIAELLGCGFYQKDTTEEADRD
ncbi:hypothetical protein AB0J48_20635 [Nocardia salmonicida]|uniref:hypothetical protein n=1 Tax=Nocardia salmonicida TaxID=53431 RepID=UPI0034280E0F